MMNLLTEHTSTNLFLTSESLGDSHQNFYVKADRIQLIHNTITNSWKGSKRKGKKSLLSLLLREVEMRLRA